MDPDNVNTAFGHRDAVGDITLLSIFDENDKNAEKDALKYMKVIDKEFLSKISPYYYPGHPRSYDVPDAPVSEAFYDSKNKPWLYQKLKQIKGKYDPNNILSNPVTIVP